MLEETDGFRDEVRFEVEVHKIVELEPVLGGACGVGFDDLGVYAAGIRFYFRHFVL